MTKADLIRGAKQRDSDAWAAIYDRLYPVIFKYAFTFTGTRMEAEDIAAEVFLDALRTVQTLPDQGKPIDAWVLGIARSLISKHSRKKRRENRASSESDIADAREEVGDQVIERVDLTRALAKLTTEQRDVIILRFFMSMSIREAAAHLGKTENATSVLQVRAVGALKRQLSDAKVARIMGHRGVSA